MAKEVKMKCIGFGEKRNQCYSNINLKYASKYWCDPCEEKRRKHITKQMKDILESFKQEGG